MPSTKLAKNIQKLANKIITLSRFISRLVDKCLSFFKLLRNTTRFIWDDHYEKAFIELKEYLSFPPILVSLESSEKLYVYLIASEETFTAVLVKETPKGQLPVYYVSKSTT